MTGGDTQQGEHSRQRGFIGITLPRLVGRAVVIQTLVVLGVVWGYSGWRMHSDRAETLASSRDELRAIAAGMYVHLQAVLNDSLGAARAAAQSITTRSEIESIALSEIAQVLSRELSSGDYVRALFIATPGRFVCVARDKQVLAPEHPPEWFEPTLQPNSAVHVGRTIADPVDPHQRAFPIAVRLSDSTGGSVWVGALLGVEALDQLYESMAVRDGSLSLVSGWGDLLLRVPGIAEAAQPINVGKAPAFRQGAALPREGGLIEAPNPVLGGTWIYAVRTLGGYRLTVAAGRDKQAILQPWRERTRGLIYVLAGVTVLFVALSSLLRHFIHRLEWANTNLAYLNTELESRVVARTTQLREANQQLALANQELEAFTASASHDLRSPLGAIAGQAGLLRDELDGLLTPVARQRIDRIQSNVMRSSEIIDGLLSLARIARQELLNERVDLSALARSIIEELRQQFPEHRVECVIESDLVVNADPRLMKSLLFNLLSNAWKYTSKNPNARIELARTRAPQSAVFSVRDNGAGFDMAGAERIFEPFHRLHAMAEFPGLGIGLATVARIVHRYAGRITVDSEVGKGATFRFTLPAAAL